MAGTATGRPAATTGPPDGDGALAEAGALISLLRETAGRYLDLFAAEVRQAGVSVTMMLTAGILLAVFVTGTWGLLCAAVAVGVWSVGSSLAVCLLVLALFNAAGAFAAVLAIRSLSRGLRFSATRRSLDSHREADRAAASAHS